MYYIAMRIGCLECGVRSKIIGVFTNPTVAECACLNTEALNGEETGTKYEIYEISGLDELFFNAAIWEYE